MTSSHAGGLDSLDQNSVEQEIAWLSKTAIRKPVKIERIRTWMNQFEPGAEKALGTLILRNLIFRTNDQFASVMRQSIKDAVQHFLNDSGNSKSTTWKEALQSNTPLSFTFGPPSLTTLAPSSPGKSGEVVTRLLKQRYKAYVDYPSEITTLRNNERLIIVDDGIYSGHQLHAFLEKWSLEKGLFKQQRGQIALAVGIAHTSGKDYLRRAFPDLLLFCGETLTDEACFPGLAAKWIKNKQWTFVDDPMTIYRQVYDRHTPFTNGLLPNGFSSLGAVLSFEHGVPDDSLQLLWDSSSSWTPLFDR